MMNNHTAALPATASETLDLAATAKEQRTLMALSWPLEMLNNGVPLLVRQAGLASHGTSLADPRPLAPPMAADETTLTRWLAAATHDLGCAVQAVTWHFGDSQALVQRVAPAVLCIPNQPEPRFLLMLKAGAPGRLGKVVLLAPDQRQVRVSAATLTTFLQTQAGGTVGEAVERLLVSTGVAAARIPKAKRALITEQMRDQRFGGCWLLKVAPHAALWQHLRYHHLPRYLLLLVGLTLVQQLLFIISWRYIGAGVFQTGFTTDGLTAWALILLTIIPLGLLATWAQINVTLNLSRFARTQMLQGILNLNPSAIRHLGAGQFLARVMQTESFQTLLLGGGFAVINALLQIGLAALILRLGVGGNWHSALLVIWLLVIIGLSLWYAHRFLHWRHTYRTLTNDLVERMVAHRTRLAQEEKATWHRAEDQQLDHYHAQSRRLDNLHLLLNTVLQRGWFLLGLAGIAIPVINGADNPSALAVSIGGILLASSAFAALRAAIVTLADIYATWRDIGPIFRAAHQPHAVGTLLNIPTSPPIPQEHAQGARRASQPLLVARQVQFRYHVTAPLTLNKLNLTIHPGERLLLEGPSGGGKSTLASLLVGLQQPDSGLLLLHGLDQQTLGLINWRQRVVSAPQFHENYVLTESFGFNLLMGRRWPATPADLRAAEAICRELGLGDLLDRMPGGMMQMVGESGWQLSHGERSRLFIARALLQEADLIVLDESFAALDPANLERAITCVLRRAPTLLVIAHP